MRITLIIICLSFSILGISQQKYQSLLWKISGNGLEKESYLYGTMHVSKKVAFRLDDVFFDALDKSEIIALETDPSTWPEFNYEQYANEMSAYSKYQGYGSNFYESLFKIIVPKDKMVRSAIRLDNSIINNYLYRKNSYSDNFEEETYLDLFIYQAGKKNGKKILALEDLEESQYLVFKAMKNSKKDEIDPWLQKLYNKESPYNIQENLYRDRNLDLLDSISIGSETEHFRTNMLYIRNSNMVNELTRAIKNNSVFAAVGAAHLPGDEGVINLLRELGYSVKPLQSKQTDKGKIEKSKLDSLFTSPILKKHTTPDGFITLNTHDKLREFSYGGMAISLDPDMTNGAYLTINRVSRFKDFPSETEIIDLEKIDRLLYEDIPGEIINKTKVTKPYPGIIIVNKTKKGEFQNYHIYQTPLEIIILKYAGKSDFALNYKSDIFKELKLKQPNDDSFVLKSPSHKFQVQFPDYHITSNFNNGGQKFAQGYKDDSYYFLIESPAQDLEYIESDQFEAKYIHKAFYENLKIEQEAGEFKKFKYETYESKAIIDSTTNKRIHLKSVVKDGSYYLLGYISNHERGLREFYDSFKFNKPLLEGFKIIKDTSLHFSVSTNIKQPSALSRNGYRNSKKSKDYTSKTKTTTYSSKSNDLIEVKRYKYHDLKMYEHIDSLWIEKERASLVKSTYNSTLKRKFEITDKIKTNKDGIYTFQFTLKDAESSKRILKKYILKEGVIFELKTLIDSVMPPSKFITEFYNSFTLKDTLTGKDILKDKTDQFFKALKNNDSLIHDDFRLVKFNSTHSKKIKNILTSFDFPEERKNIKSFFAYQLVKNDFKKNQKFIKKLYKDSYSNPETQTYILSALLNLETDEAFKFYLELLEIDLPLEYGGLGNFYRFHNNKSLKKYAKLFPILLDYASIQEYKNPIYDLLAKLKDSSLATSDTYIKYKNQIITDGKIEIKRSLSNSSSYGNETDLVSYIKLVFPFRKEKNVKLFFENLLLTDDNSALTTYYALLVKFNEKIPSKLIDKTLKKEDKLHFLINTLENYDLLKKAKLKDIDQLDYLTSLIKQRIKFEKEKDSLIFLSKRTFKTDSKGMADMYFFKYIGEDNYSSIKSEKIYCYAFLKSKDGKSIQTDIYYSSGYGEKIDKTIDLENQLEQHINLAIYKNRKRVTKSKSYDDDYGYYDY